MKNFFEKQKGITLVALVVTIIVLLILAGVSLSLISGSNGILGKAQNATELSKLAEMKEQMQLDLVAAQMDAIMNGEMNISEKNLTEIVKKYGELQEDGDTIVTQNGNISLKEMYGKLSGMDNGSNETVDNVELSKLVTEIQNLKTQVGTLKTANDTIQSEVNTLKTNDTSMQSSITALRDSLFPTNYITPETVNGVHNVNGGYYRIGNTVYVCMNFNVNETILPLSTQIGRGISGLTPVALGLPIPAKGNSLDFGYPVTSGYGYYSGRGVAGVSAEGKLCVAKKGTEAYENNTGTYVVGTYLAKE